MDGVAAAWDEVAGAEEDGQAVIVVEIVVPIAEIAVIVKKAARIIIKVVRHVSHVNHANHAKTGKIAAVRSVEFAGKSARRVSVVVAATGTSEIVMNAMPDKISRQRSTMNVIFRLWVKKEMN
jgi:hypothetical protein